MLIRVSADEISSHGVIEEFSLIVRVISLVLLRNQLKFPGLRRTSNAGEISEPFRAILRVFSDMLGST